MIDKRAATISEALAGVPDGAVLLVGGFGLAGSPTELLEGLIDHSAGGFTVVSNNAGEGERGLAALLNSGKIRKIICSYPRSAGSVIFDDLYNAGKIELEVVPQGTLSERMRAAGAGVGGFYTRTSAGTKLGDGKEVRTFGGEDYVLEKPIKGDVALIKAQSADRWGNLTYNMTARNFGPTMAMAAAYTVVQVTEFHELAETDPERVVTPGLFVDKVVKTGDGT